MFVRVGHMVRPRVIRRMLRFSYGVTEVDVQVWPGSCVFGISRIYTEVFRGHDVIYDVETVD